MSPDEQLYAEYVIIFLILYFVFHIRLRKGDVTQLQHLSLSGHLPPFKIKVVFNVLITTTQCFLLSFLYAILIIILLLYITCTISRLLMLSKYMYKYLLRMD